MALYSTEAPISSPALTRATQSLRHRGGDEIGQWISARGDIGLGHTRLNIVDLSTGRQPIANEDNSIHLIVNGEFYGYESIRADLERRGHRFRTRSDSEIALHLYEEMGANCLEYLRGEFAFVIWNESKRELFAARDRFGIKPLFYAELDNTLYLASEAKALFAAGVNSSWDHETVFHTMFLCLDQRRSLFNGIKQIPPGHYLVANKGNADLHQYWDVAYPIRGRPLEMGNLELVERVRFLLEEAVRLRTVADVPVGVLLSGGLDSSAVLGLTAKHVEGPVAAFTVAFDDQAYDESPGAAEMVAHVSADFRKVFISDNDLAANFTQTVIQGEGIQFNGHGVARFLLSRAIRQAGYKVVLGGEGADELFAGYRFQQQMLEAAGTGGISKWLGLPGRLIRNRSETEAAIAKTSPWLFRVSRVLGVPAAQINLLGEVMSTMRSILAEDFLDDFRGRDPYYEFFQGIGLSNLIGREPVKQITYIWLKSIFANYHMAADRLDMAHEVEVRLPFLDHKLFEFASQIPTEKLVVDGRGKSPLREAAKPYISANVYERIKKPFWAPPLSGRKDSKFYELIQDIVHGDSIRKVTFLNSRAIVSIADRLPRMANQTRAGSEALLLMLASIAVLQDHYEL